MEQIMPIEEVAKQRLSALAFSYTLLVKHLMEEGVELAKVRRASDKVWAVLGAQAAEQMKPFFPQPVDINALQQAGAMAEAVHGIEVRRKMTPNAIATDFLSCPWQDAYVALGMPEEWRLCPSGHAAFAQSMFKGLTPKAGFELSQTMPAGAKVCEGKTTI